MRYEGTLIWSNGERSIVRDAIVDLNHIAFDAPYPMGTYHVVLRPHPKADQWVGEWTSAGRANRVNARVNRLGDDVELTGRWLDGQDYGWELALSLQE